MRARCASALRGRKGTPGFALATGFAALRVACGLARGVAFARGADLAGAFRTVRRFAVLRAGDLRDLPVFRVAMALVSLVALKKRCGR